METTKSNIIQFINLPNFDKNLGKNWYKNANSDLVNILAELQLSAKLTISEVSLICSILSPANRWETNLTDVKTVLTWFFYERHRNKEIGKCSTYGNNVKKAISFLTERSNYRLINSHLDSYQVSQRFSNDWGNTNMKAQKTLNFWYNLRNPRYKDPLFFTIDRHMLKIAGIEKQSLTVKQYKELQTVYLEVWLNSGIDCLFHEFQAILWANYVFLKRGIIHY
jgi:hypothetical protein